MAATRVQGLLVCVAFGATASSLNLGNKYLMKQFNFYATFTVLCTQLLVIQSLLVLASVAALKLRKVPVPELSVRGLLKLYRLGVLYVLHILFGIFAISRLNVPM